MCNRGASGTVLACVLSVHALKPTLPRLQLLDGSAAEVVDDTIEIRAPDGALIFRYQDGEAELVAPAGALRLSAPNGGIVMDAAGDIEVVAARDIVQRPGRRLEVEARELSVVTNRGRVTAECLEVASAQVRAVADRIVTRANHHELEAGRVVQRARSFVSEVTGLFQQRLGRARTLVEGLHLLRSGRTVMRSEADTSIDGRKVLLG